MKKFAEKGINIVVGGTEILNSKKFKLIFLTFFIFKLILYVYNLNLILYHLFASRFMEMIKEYMLATQFSM